MNSATEKERWLLEQIKLAEDQVTFLRTELHEERLKRAGVKIGDVVTRRGKQYVVSTIDTTLSFGRDKPWVKGKLVKVDGTPSSAETHLFAEWMVVSSTVTKRTAS